jgi:hypothetical protein
MTILARLVLNIVIVFIRAVCNTWEHSGCLYCLSGCQSEECFRTLRYIVPLFNLILGTNFLIWSGIMELRTSKFTLCWERNRGVLFSLSLGVMHQIKKLADPDVPLGMSPPKSSDSTVSVKQQELNCLQPQPGPSSSAFSLSVVSSGGLAPGSSSSVGSAGQVGVVSRNTSPNGSIMLGRCAACSFCHTYLASILFIDVLCLYHQFHLHGITCISNNWWNMIHVTSVLN